MESAVAAGPPAEGPTVASQLLGWDHLEWWVGNARAFVTWLTWGFGFEVAAYAGPETGLRDRVSYLLRQGDVRFVVTGATSTNSEVAQHVMSHGDGVRDLAWRVKDVESTLRIAERAGATIVEEPVTDQGDEGCLTHAAIGTYGGCRHSFIDRSGWTGVWGPMFTDQRLPRIKIGGTVGVTSIDHVVGNVEEGRLDDWVDWYREVLGLQELQRFDDDQISTQYSALRSTVVHNGAGVVMPLNEPAAGLRKSQISEYLEAHGGPGVQHIALATPSIVTAVEGMAARGVRFLDMPSSYYEDARHRCGQFELDWTTLEHLGVEVDHDGGGYLLQIFTEMISDRPTVFVEVIQREGAVGFGEGNFKALFEAIEREQGRRGNL